MTSEGVLSRDIEERKYTVEHIVPLFKAMQSVYREYKFDWIEVQLNSIKEVKQLFPKFDLTMNRADGVCMKASSNKEIVFIEVSGGPKSTVAKHVWEDSEKLIKEAMFGLVSLLRDHLGKNAANASNIHTYMVQVIGNNVSATTSVLSSAQILHKQSVLGDRMTLSEICLSERYFYTVSQIKSAVLPFSFDDVEKFLDVFELLYTLLVSISAYA